MKVIMRGYGRGSVDLDLQAADLTRIRGTSKVPFPPRDVVCQSGPRGILVTWHSPVVDRDIQRWRVYRDDETSLYAEIKDRGLRQCFVETTSGATPPVVNIFISAMNAAGVESPKAYAQGSATAEAGAPPMPSVPPEYTEVASGGGDTSTDYANYEPNTHE